MRATLRSLRGTAVLGLLLLAGCSGPTYQESNLADSLQVWTNDRYRAAVHRVVPMTRRDRYSIPYFFNPPFDAVIRPIDEICEDGPRYRPFTWREFIQARIDDNFADPGVDDTQASHFRIA